MISWLINRLIERAKQRPYIHIPGYMERFWLIGPSKWHPFEVRVHHIMRSDNDRHLHDHPRPNLSIILRGGYLEILPIRQDQHPSLDQHGFLCARPRYPGMFIFRRRRTRHRLVLTNPCWSLFITIGPGRPWGFYRPTGWVWWREYLDIWERKHA